MSERFDDDELLDALEAAIEGAHPMPASAAELARGAWDARALDAEFAELVADSVADADQLAIRAVTGPRLLSFEGRGLAIELELEPVGTTTHRVAGQLLPARSASVTLERGVETLRARADASGRFAFEPVGEGTVRLRVEDAGHRAVVSAWFRL
jgi:hypothetical protein